ncbi:MAG TPA: caspase family protein [Fibrobacteria bacterium]|nr:caspase family protein [Fibrobacteria bacterium]
MTVLFLACAASAEVQRIAVFVGEDRGLEDERPLRYASRDAKEMAEAFRRAGTFDEDRVYLLLNPSLEKIKSSLQEVKGRVRELRKAGTETLVMIYYSGHGSSEGLHVQANLYRLAAPVECELFLPHRFWVSLSEGMGFYFYNYQTGEETGTRGVFEPAISIGHQF